MRTSLDLIDIPAGTYTLGSTWDEAETPVHTVALDAFQLGRVPVTNEAFAAFIAADGYATERWWTALGWRWVRMRHVDRPGFWGQAAYMQPQQPVVGVAWFEADAYCRWLAEQTGLAVRLPTEAEWEAAARGLEARTFPWGERFEPGRANTRESGLGRPSPVGMFPAGASPFGALDMAGNVYEWVSTAWGKGWQSLDFPYPYRPTDGREDLVGSPARVMRGGSWFNPWPDARGAARARYLPGSRGSNIGFRVAVGGGEGMRDEG